MGHPTTALRGLANLTSVFFVCGLTGCGRQPETVDKDPPLQIRQPIERERANGPAPVPENAREILYGKLYAITSLVVSPGGSKLLVDGLSSVDDFEFPGSKAFLVDLKEEQVQAQFDLNLYRSVFSVDERKMAAIGLVGTRKESLVADADKQKGRTVLEQLLEYQISSNWTYDVRIANLATGEWETTVGSSSSKIHAIGWNHDGRQVITAALNRPMTTETERQQAVSERPGDRLSFVGESQIEFSYWDSENGQLLQTVVGPALNYDNAVLNAEGTMVALWDSTAPAAIVICNPNNGQEIYRLSGHIRAVQEVSFSPSGQYLASIEVLSGNPGTKVVVWDMETGERFSEFDCNASYMAFSPDCKQLATSNAFWVDELNRVVWNVSIWDVATGTELKTLNPGGKGTQVAYLSNTELLTTSRIEKNGVLIERLLAWDVSH